MLVESQMNMQVFKDFSHVHNIMISVLCAFFLIHIKIVENIRCIAHARYGIMNFVFSFGYYTQHFNSVNK